MIVGKKVGLRAVEKEDLELLRDWRNISSFRKNFREVRELSLADQEKWFESLQSNKHLNYMFTIVDISTGEAIGACGLLYINWIIRAADFSFYIGKNNEYIDEKGYADEAAQILIEYGFHDLNLNKIWMELYEYDSQKLDFFQRKFKFKQDGILRENCFAEGKYWDSYIISLLKKEYGEEKNSPIPI